MDNVPEATDEHSILHDTERIQEVEERRNSKHAQKLSHEN